MSAASTGEAFDEREVSPSPFRAAFGRARHEASAAAPIRDPRSTAGAEPLDFEYRLLKRRGKRAAEEYAWNALGRQGWELVGLTAEHAAFKRPL